MNTFNGMRAAVNLLIEQSPMNCRVSGSTSGCTWSHKNPNSCIIYVQLSHDNT